MPPHKCCSACPTGTCCDSGCECWEDVYAASVPSFEMGRNETCYCCGACAGTVEEVSCCYEIGPNGLSDPNCEVFADPGVHKCCFAFDWKISGGSIKIYRTGNLFPCTNTLFPRTCPDPWSPPTRSVQDTAPGCNVYETDYGLVGGDYVYPCPDVPHEDYIDIEFEREVYGAACDNCPFNFINLQADEQDARVQARVPVKAWLSCCGDAGTSKSGCAPCEGDTLPGSGVPHYLVIEPLAGVQYNWNEFGQTTQIFMPPTLVFSRRLSCSSTPAGEWRFLGTGPFSACQGQFVGFSGICPCVDTPPTCYSKCSATENSLCDCSWEFTGTCQPSDFQCPACSGQEDPTFGDISLGAST